MSLSKHRKPAATERNACDKFEIILGLLFIAALVQPLARRLDVPIAIAQVVAGMALAFVPVVHDLEDLRCVDDQLV